MKTKVLVFTARNRAEFVPREIPDLREGEILIRNRISLVSPGTELALYSGSHIGFGDPEVPWARYPIDAGYASTGIVEESRSPEAPAGMAVMHYGNHAPVTVLDTTSAMWAPVPAGLDMREASFGRFAQIARSAVIAAVRPAQSVLVYGAGIVGNLAAQWFALDTDRSVAVRDLSPVRLAMARQCGLSVEETQPPKPDTIVEATGVPAVVIEALMQVAPSGQVILLGSSRGTVELNAYKLVHRKAVILSGAHETILGATVREVLKTSLELIAAGALRVAPLITHTIPPDELPGIYDRIAADRDQYTGVFVDWSSGNG